MDVLEVVKQRRAEVEADHLEMQKQLGVVQARLAEAEERGEDDGLVVDLLKERQQTLLQNILRSSGCMIFADTIIQEVSAPSKVKEPKTAAKRPARTRK